MTYKIQGGDYLNRFSYTDHRNRPRLKDIIPYMSKEDKRIVLSIEFRRFFDTFFPLGLFPKDLMDIDESDFGYIVSMWNKEERTVTPLSLQKIYI